MWFRPAVCFGIKKLVEPCSPPMVVIAETVIPNTNTFYVADFFKSNRIVSNTG